MIDLIRTFNFLFTCIFLMTYFVNRQSGNYDETVDEFENKAEALKMKEEYQFSEHGRAYYYVSQVCKSNWSN